MPVDLPLEQPQVVQSAAPTQLAAFELFESACINGRVSLDAKTIERVEFKQLPSKARAVLRYALLPGENNLPGASPLLRSSQVPDQIYRLTYSPEAYLVLPGRGNDTAFTNVCAVIVKGDSYSEARRAIFGRASPRPKGPGPGVTLPYISTSEGGYRLSAAEHEGWTIASTVPDAEPSGDVE